MSILTQIARAFGYGPVLNAVEGVEKAAGIHAANPTPETAQALTDAAAKAKSTAIAASTSNTEATIVVHDLGGMAGSMITSMLARKLGAAAPIAETVANDLLDELEALILAKLPA